MGQLRKPKTLKSINVSLYYYNFMQFFLRVGYFFCCYSIVVWLLPCINRVPVEFSNGGLEKNEMKIEMEANIANEMVSIYSNRKLFTTCAKRGENIIVFTAAKIVFFSTSDCNWPIIFRRLMNWQSTRLINFITFK